MQVLNLTKVC